MYARGILAALAVGYAAAGNNFRDEYNFYLGGTGYQVPPTGDDKVIAADAADALISPSQTTSALGDYSYSYDPAPTMAPTSETRMPTATMAPTHTETYAPTRMTEAPSYAPTTDTYAPTSMPSVTGAPSVSPVPMPAPVPRGNLRA